jgi:hypothetical protein
MLVNANRHHHCHGGETMLYENQPAESEKSHAQPQNTNLGAVRATTAEMSGAVHALVAQAGVTVVDLRADVVDGKLALWLHDGQSEVSVGELDTLEITGPPAAEWVELRIGDIAAGGAVGYQVSGQNEAGCSLGAWPRNEAETGIRCVLAMPSDSAQTNWIKFTINATPLLGQPVPLALDPLGVVKKEGAG